MKAMTQNEAREYVSDDSNWHVADETPYVRTKRLTYESCSYLMIETKQITNVIERYINKDTPAITDFKPALHFIFDKENDCIGACISVPQIAKEVWAESRRVASESIR